jgi:hypothetical protein
MTIEELLKPRYKVISTYPLSDFKVGQIIESESWGVSIDAYYIEFSFLNYPKIFQELKWWEERQIEYLPKYLKIDDSIRKVIKWDLAWDKVIVTNLISQEERRNYIGIYTPLSEEEYLQFTNQKEL